MKFFYNLERKYRKYAVHNLMNYIVIMYVTGMVIQMVNPMFYYRFLALDVSEIMRGQVWRIVTFLIWPPFDNLLSNLIMIYLYYSIGNTLEHVWGAFRFNVYFFMGAVGHVLAAIVVYLVFGQVWLLTSGNLNMSLLFAFAATFPDLQFMLYFVIPIKAKWLALFYGIVSLYSVVVGGAAQRCTILLSFANFIIFFLMTRDYGKISPKEFKRKRDFQKKVKITPPGGTHHRCAVCGRTELDGEDLEFRYCSKCEGSYEYCQEHLYTHQHVVKSTQNDSINQ